MKERRRIDRRGQDNTVPMERRRKERRRRDRRCEVRVPIEMWMEEVKGDELYFRRTGNLSIGGVFFEQSIPHPIGQRVHLRFELPGTGTEIGATGEIVSASADDQGLGMGVKFIDIDGDGREALSDFILAAKESDDGGFD